MSFQNKYIFSHFAKGKRLDGRKFDEQRKIEIETNVIPQAEGSARVKIGDTEVIAGVKMGMGTPFPDSQEEGVLIVNAEFSPLASPEFELGPPRENSIELARVVDRGIRESKSIDTKKLCVEKGEKVWMVFIDINPINHDGNLLDAAGIAAITALHSAKMPKYDKKEDKVLYGEDDKPLPINNMPIPVTFGFIDGKVMVDPRIEEERAIQTRITITTMTNGNITALQKARPGAFTLESLEEATDISIKLGKEIRKLIKKSL